MVRRVTVAVSFRGFKPVAFHLWYPTWNLHEVDHAWIRIHMGWAIAKEGRFIVPVDQSESSSQWSSGFEVGLLGEELCCTGPGNDL